MKDRIFLINILTFDDPIRCNYREINDKMSKCIISCIPPKLADTAISLVFACNFKINILGTKTLQG